MSFFGFSNATPLFFPLSLSQERLDFSCALFGPDGGLVSNAPHIPVHLGAMQDTVRHQVGQDRGQGGEGGWKCI